MTDKLHKIFDTKRLLLRKNKWESRDWEEYHFEVEFKQEWEAYLKGLDCELVPERNLSQEWNAGKGRNTLCVENPEHKREWILVPTEIAEKALVLGFLP